LSENGPTISSDNALLVSLAENQTVRQKAEQTQRQNQALLSRIQALPIPSVELCEKKALLCRIQEQAMTINQLRTQGEFPGIL
jgi:hypothetical protein